MEKKSLIKKIIKDLIVTFLFVSFATLLGRIFYYFNLQETNVVITYLLSVLLVSRLTDGYIFGILATISSLILFNWFFTDPIFTLNVSDPTYTITFIIMTITAIITSAVTTKAKKALSLATSKEKEANTLYKMTNLLTDAEDTSVIAGIAVKTIGDILNCDPAIILFNEQGDLEDSFIQQKKNKLIRRELSNKEEIKKRILMLHNTYDEDNEFYNYPIYGRTKILAILRVPETVASVLTESQTRIIYSVIESTALALDRLISIKEEVKSREEATKEHYRGNLLRSISHDIRTPLSGIMGSAEMLIGMTKEDDPRYEIASGVYKDADWLHSLVENILNLTKIHDGKLNIVKVPEAVEEVIGASLMVIEKRFPKTSVIVDIPENLVMIPMDARLISQVLINLIDNAVKHAGDDKEIKVSVEVFKKEALFRVSDKGPGIPLKDIENIFKMFYTTRDNEKESIRGVGLGLSICQSIVEAHGGKISAKNKIEGGAEFSFSLPLEGENNGK